MARLPIPGQDEGVWGELLNQYLQVSFDADGTVKAGAVTKDAIGLGNVDNTSDSAKPISSAVQTALSGKVSKTGDTMTGDLAFGSGNSLTFNGAAQYLRWDASEGLWLAIADNNKNLKLSYGGGTGRLVIDQYGYGEVVSFSNGAASFSGDISVSGTGGGGGGVIKSPIGGAGLYLKGVGSDSNEATLRIIGNDNAYLDGVSVAYFQADYRNSRNLIFQSGTYGADSPLDRLMFNAHHTVFSGGSYTGVPTPTATLEVRGSEDIVQQRVVANSSQTQNISEWRDGNSNLLVVFDSTGSVGVGQAPNSKLHVGGSFATTVNSVTDDYVVTSGDATILGSAALKSIQVTLPTAVGITGRLYTIKRTDGSGNTMTVATTLSQTIDGTTNYSLSAQWKYVTVQSDGANWFVVANN